MTPKGSLGKRIAQARLQAGAARGKAYTQTELAKAVGVTPPTVSQWEADASEPELAMIQRIGDALGIDPAFLAFGPPPSGVHSLRASFKTFTPEEIAEARRIVAEAERNAPPPAQEQETEHRRPRRRSNGR